MLQAWNLSKKEVTNSLHIEEKHVDKKVYLLN